MFVFNGVLGTDGLANVNATAVNKLLSKFDINAVSEPLETPSNALYIPTKNKTSLVKGVTKLTHFGNYLEIDLEMQYLIQWTQKEEFQVQFILQITEAMF